MAGVVIEGRAAHPHHCFSRLLKILRYLRAVFNEYLSAKTAPNPTMAKRRLDEFLNDPGDPGDPGNPGNPGNPGDYCLRCQDMMSFDGFVKLLSKDGFQHLSRNEVGTSKCPLCEFFRAESSGRWTGRNVLVLSLRPGITDSDVGSVTRDDVVSTLAGSGGRLACSELVGQSREEGGALFFAFSTKLFTPKCKSADKR